MEADYECHRPYCHVIGTKKGRCILLTDDAALRFQKIREKAKCLNEDGSLRVNARLFKILSKTGDIKKISHVKQTTARKPRPEYRKRKSKRSARKNKGKISNGSNVLKSGHNVKKEGKKTVENLIAGGRFGGPVLVDTRIASGLSFGEGWYKLKTETKKTQLSETTTARNKWVKMKFDDFYSESADDNQKEKRQELRSEIDEQLVPLFEAGTSLRETTTEQEPVKHDLETAEDKQTRDLSCQNPLTLETCCYCKKTGHMLKCSRCKMANYCAKECQQRHYSHHKRTCSKYK